jgi:hypothetical protein
MSTTFEVSDAEFPEGLLADVRVTVGQVDFQASVELSGEVSFAACLSEPLRGAVVASVRKYVLDSLRRQFAALDALEARETRAEEFTQHAQRPPEFGTGGAA